MMTGRCFVRPVVCELCQLVRPARHSLRYKSVQRNSVPQLTSDSAAGEVVDVVLRNRTNPDSVLLECNPGEGLLTEKFLRHGVRSLVVAEKRPEYLQVLESKARENGDMRLMKWNFFQCLRSPLSPWYLDHKKLESNLMDMIPDRGWSDDPGLTIFGVVPPKDTRILRHLIELLSPLGGIYGKGRAEWFLFVTHRTWRALLCGEEGKGPLSFYRAPGTLINLLYHVKIHTKVPTTDFQPVYSTKLKTDTKIGSEMVSRREVPLVQLTPRHNLYSEILPVEEIPRFFRFLQQVLQRRTMRLIPRMETWVPGYGVCLIQQGYSMLDTIGSIKPQQFLDIYKDLLGNPAFRSSTLCGVLEGKCSHLDQFDSLDLVTDKPALVVEEDEFSDQHQRVIAMATKADDIITRRMMA